MRSWTRYAAPPRVSHGSPGPIPVWGLPARAPRCAARLQRTSRVPRAHAPFARPLLCAAQVKGIIAEQLGVELDLVVPGASFTEDLGADSLDAVELIMAIEEAFDIEIPDEEAETMTTPADCVTAIKGKI